MDCSTRFLRVVLRDFLEALTILFFLCSFCMGQAWANTRASPYWSPWTTDGARPVLCRGAVSGLKCKGRYCDDVALKCVPRTAESERGATWGPWFSEEGKNSFVCPGEKFVTGLRCKDDYCDDLSLRCERLPELERRRCYYTAEVSEEGGGTLSLGEGVYVAGMKCSGRYCDNKRLYVCETKKATCESDACKQRVAQRFAPLMRFDQVQAEPNKCFPEDAAKYYQLRKAGSRRRSCNQRAESLSGGQIPIYYEYANCGANIQIIKYWFFYGYQDTCFGNLGSHDGDWESIVVKVVNGQLNRVQFHQHGGHYTKLKGRFERRGNHPVVYVGKTAHGSYHDTGGTGGCLYFEDFRNPGEKNYQLKTWQNLVSLKNDRGAPEWMRYTGREIFGTTPPLARKTPLCALSGCDGRDFSIGETLCFGQCGCLKSDIGGNPF